MLICQHCGRESSENATTCARCGMSLAPQFSTRYLQPPASYRAQHYTSQKSPEPAYPAHTFHSPYWSRAPHALYQPIEVQPSPFGISALICGVASLVSGIMGIMYLPIVGIIFGILAIPLGSIGLIRKEMHSLIGIALGIIGLILGLLWTVISSTAF